MTGPDSQDITQIVLVPAPLPEGRFAGVRWLQAGLRLLGILAGAALIALAGYLIFRDDRPLASLPLAPAAAREIPPALHTYYTRALAGDPAAMRMLGTAYCNGLYVAQDREEGILWYRKAAKSGSVAAQKDLELLGIKQ